MPSSRPSGVRHWPDTSTETVSRPEFHPLQPEPGALCGLGLRVNPDGLQPRPARPVQVVERGVGRAEREPAFGVSGGSLGRATTAVARPDPIAEAATHFGPERKDRRVTSDDHRPVQKVERTARIALIDPGGRRQAEGIAMLAIDRYGAPGQPLGRNSLAPVEIEPPGLCQQIRLNTRWQIDFGSDDLGQLGCRLQIRAESDKRQRPAMPRRGPPAVAHPARCFSLRAGRVIRNHRKAIVIVVEGRRRQRQRGKRTAEKHHRLQHPSHARDPRPDGPTIPDRP